MILHSKALAYLQTEVPGGYGYLAFASNFTTFQQNPQSDFSYWLLGLR